MMWVLIGNILQKKNIDKQKGRAGCVKIGLKHKDVSLDGGHT